MKRTEPLCLNWSPLSKAIFILRRKSSNKKNIKLKTRLSGDLSCEGPKNMKRQYWLNLRISIFRDLKILCPPSEISPVSLPNSRNILPIPNLLAHLLFLNCECCPPPPFGLKNALLGLPNPSLYSHRSNILWLPYLPFLRRSCSSSSKPGLGEACVEALQ